MCRKQSPYPFNYLTEPLLVFRYGNVIFSWNRKFCSSTLNQIYAPHYHFCFYLFFFFWLCWFMMSLWTCYCYVNFPSSVLVFFFFSCFGKWLQQFRNDANSDKKCEGHSLNCQFQSYFYPMLLSLNFFEQRPQLIHVYLWCAIMPIYYVSILTFIQM